MRSVWMTLGLAMLLAVSAPCGATPSARVAQQHTASVDEVRAAIRDAYTRFRNNDLAAAAKGFDSAVDAASFGKLSVEEQYAVLALDGDIAVRQQRNETAFRLLQRATAFSLAGGADWHRRLAAAFALRNYPDSAACIATIARRWPETLDGIRGSAISLIDRQLRSDPAAASVEFEFLDGLFDARWTEDGVQPNFLWLGLARRLIERKDLDKAAVVLGRIDAPRAALVARIDKRFDPLVRDRKSLDIDRIAAARVAAQEARVRAAPDQLGPLVDLQYLLIDTLQFTRVVDTSDEVIRKAAGREQEMPYVDFKEKFIWILDDRGRALQALGRWDEAVADLKKAARRPEGGDMNVSQALNLGILYAGLDRPADALDAVADLGRVSDFGRMQLQMVKLMVAVERNEPDTVDAQLSQMKEHRIDAISTYQKALLQAGRMDAAAALLIERLRSEEWRGDALVEMQEYAEVPTTARWRERHLRWREVIRRADVQAELAQVGRIEQVNLAPPDL